MNPRMPGRLFDATLKFFHSPLLLYPLSTLWYGFVVFRFGASGLLFAGVPFSLFFGFLAAVFCFQGEQGGWNQSAGILDLLLVLVIAGLGIVPGVNLIPAWLVSTRRKRRRLKRLAAGRHAELKGSLRMGSNGVVPPLGDVSVNDVKVNRRRARK
jgi:hypothetical protein